MLAAHFTRAPKSLIAGPTYLIWSSTFEMKRPRWQVGGGAIEELRRFGGWKELDEEAPINC